MPGGDILGGTCSYSAVTAHNLGQSVAIVTSSGPDLPDTSAIKAIPQKHIPAAQSTVFENTYVNGKRYQKWSASARQITFPDIPPAWRQPKIVHLGLVSQEVSPDICQYFPNSLIGVTVQGWLRGTDADHTVIFQPHPDLERWLNRIDVMTLSLADVFGDRDMLAYLLDRVKLGVETVGPNGCKIYHDGCITEVPVRAEPEVDPTGAGDIFSAAFLIKYEQTRNPLQAAHFANACASLSVGKVGLAGVPTLTEVTKRTLDLYATSVDDMVPCP